MEQMLQVGILSSTHGVRGEMKVFPTTDDAARFKKLKSVLLDTGSGLKEMQIEGVKFFKQFVILKFKDHDSINDIERYKGHSIYVTRENAVRLKKDEYFIADLIDMKVVEEDGNELGILSDVLETGANDVYVINLSRGGELLLPAIKQCILSVDTEGGIMTVHVPEGL
ncbi:MAG: 16S rRNA processing protein RimM [Lachnospiraceae bacterium]|nr:16S rRNA processing protein RimM [Lachnospiraceae bacterium]